MTREATVSKNPRVSENFALLSMFHSVLKCSLYARSSRSISFWYLSIEKGGGVKGVVRLLGGELRIHRLHHVVDLDRAARGVVEIPADRNEEARHGAADALRERTALDAAARAPGIRAQRLQSDHIEQLAGLLGEHRTQRGEPLHAALEEFLLLGDAGHHVRHHVLVLAAQFAQIRELLGDARLPRLQPFAHVDGERADSRNELPRPRCRAWPG